MGRQPADPRPAQVPGLRRCLTFRLGVLTRQRLVFSVADHPWSLTWKAFGGDRLGGEFLAFGPGTTAAGCRMPFCARRGVRTPFINIARSASSRVQPGESGCGEQRARRHPATLFARLGLLEFRHRPQRGKRPALRTKIVVYRHCRPRQRSGARGIATPLFTPPLGPEAPGLMSKSKISVGSQSVAHEFGMSTTPLMCP
jgi:hypothetical protein